LKRDRRCCIVLVRRVQKRSPRPQRRQCAMADMGRGDERVAHAFGPPTHRRQYSAGSLKKADKVNPGLKVGNCSRTSDRETRLHRGAASFYANSKKADHKSAGAGFSARWRGCSRIPTTTSCRLFCAFRAGCGSPTHDPHVWQSQQAGAILGEAVALEPNHRDRAYLITRIDNRLPIGTAGGPTFTRRWLPRLFRMRCICPSSHCFDAGWGLQLDHFDQASDGRYAQGLQT